MPLTSPQEARHEPPATPADLWNYLWLYFGVRIATCRVCPEHNTPWEFFRAMHFDEPDQMICVGPRGGGKSFLTALDSHLKSRRTPGYGTRVLGGSLAQSAQIRAAIQEAVLNGKGPYGWNDADQIAALAAKSVRYQNGSEIQMLAASATSVRGSHVPSLKLDEVDEMKTDIRESAIGILTEKATKGWDSQGFYGPTGVRQKASVVMTSTYHRVGGPMALLLDKVKEINEAKLGSFPVFTVCAFDVLERCPDEVSGPNLEFCPACPLITWCHNIPDGDVRRGGIPRAKRGNGHYPVRSLQAKALQVSGRVFAADYLSKEPSIAGLYFPAFDPSEGGKHVPTRPNDWPNPAEYRPDVEVYMAFDPGPHSGAVFFQVYAIPWEGGYVPGVNVFADYYSVGSDVATVAEGIKEIARTLCNDNMDRRAVDPAGDSATGFGRTLLQEFTSAGLTFTDRWSKKKGSVKEGLDLIEAFLNPAAGPIALMIHPRCRHLIKALRAFRRKQVKNTQVFLDEPEDPQHPAEDLIEALRGGLRVAFPAGRHSIPGTQVPASYLTS